MVISPSRAMRLSVLVTVGGVTPSSSARRVPTTGSPSRSRTKKNDR